MSNSDDPDRKPPPQGTVAWDPEDLEDLGMAPAPAASTGTSAGAGDAADAAGTAADPGATVKFSEEDIARLVAEEAAASQEGDRLIGTLIRDKWKVLKKLGAGSFGTVYKVEDIKGGWIEALKILGVDRMSGSEAEEMRGRFLREAQIMKRLGKDSKHIVGLSTYEEDIESGLIYFLMEFVEGRSLATALSQDGPFTVDRTVALALQVCDALMAAHEGPEPVVHRDLKLENLMLTTDRSGEEVVKVLDFGIAKIVEREADSRLTTVGTLGTPGYAAPEQLRAEAVDGRTDLFAFGVILYALLTGRDPWLGNVAHEPTHQIYELMVATDRANVRPMGEAVSPVMADLVLKLLRREPDQRFQSARELRDVLLRIADGRPASSDARTVRIPAGAPVDRVAGGSPNDHTTDRSPGAPPKPRPTPPKKRRGGRIVATVLVLLAGGGTAWAQPWGRTLTTEGLLSQVRQGNVTAAWLTEGGLEGGIRVVPVEALSDLRTPFFTEVTPSDVPEVVSRLRAAGADVDVSWEARRLTDLARVAQSQNRYFGVDGGDVRSYALRLAALVPDSPEAASLLLKVGEHMAWDAEAALRDGPPDMARTLVTQCLELVASHPRCLEVSGRL